MEQWQVAAIAEAKSWINTPYHHHGRIKGVGVDCAMLICKVYENAGLTPTVDPGFYSTQFGFHRAEEEFLSWITRYAVPSDGPLPGGIVVFQYGRCFSHGGIVIEDGQFIHAVIKAEKVIRSKLIEPEYAERPKLFYRL